MEYKRSGVNEVKKSRLVRVSILPPWLGLAYFPRLVRVSILSRLVRVSGAQWR